MAEAERRRRITTTLSADEHYLLRLLAFDADMTVAAKVRQAIRSYIAAAEANGAIESAASQSMIHTDDVASVRQRFLQAYKAQQAYGAELDEAYGTDETSNADEAYSADE